MIFFKNGTCGWVAVGPILIGKGMSEEKNSRNLAKTEVMCCSSPVLRSAAPLELPELTRENYDQYIHAFSLYPDSDVFLDRLRVVMTRGELPHALTIVREFFARMHPPAIDENTLVSNLPLPVKIINALESAGFEKVMALLPLTHEQLVQQCKCTGVFGMSSAMQVMNCIREVREAYDRRNRVGLYHDLDDELMDEVAADNKFR